MQSKVPGADSIQLARQDADRALTWLTRALAAGYKDRAHLETDRDLEARRGREDFQKLLASLPVAAVP